MMASVELGASLVQAVMPLRPWERMLGLRFAGTASSVIHNTKRGSSSNSKELGKHEICFTSKIYHLIHHHHAFATSTTWVASPGFVQ